MVISNNAAHSHILCVISVTIGQVITMPIPVQPAAGKSPQKHLEFCETNASLLLNCIGRKNEKSSMAPGFERHRAFILLPGKKKEQASEEACSLLVGEAGLEPARPQ